MMCWPLKIPVTQALASSKFSSINTIAKLLIMKRDKLESYLDFEATSSSSTIGQLHFGLNIIENFQFISHQSPISSGQIRDRQEQTVVGNQGRQRSSSQG
jgi:hypothetical protein